MMFRAGFRRIDVPTPTEYKLQYTWKNPVPEQTPILYAESLFDSQREQPSNQQPTNQQHAINSGKNGKVRGSEGFQNGESFKQHRLRAASKQQNGGSAHHNDVIDGSCDHGDSPNGRGKGVPGLQQELGTRSHSEQEGRSKHNHVSDTKKKHRHHKHHSKKHKGGHSRAFLSEYKREFKVWPIPSSPGKAAAKMHNKTGTEQHGENDVC